MNRQQLTTERILLYAVIIVTMGILFSSCASWIPYRYEPLQNASYSELMNHALDLERQLGACQQKVTECK